jgi:PAS domain S-box-containing protein
MDEFVGQSRVASAASSTTSLDAFVREPTAPIARVDSGEAGADAGALQRLVSDADGWFALTRNASLIAVMVDTSAKLVYCNDFLLRLAGWARPEIIGRDWFTVFLPPPHDTMRRVFEGVLASRAEYRHYENDILTREGELRLIRWHNSVLRDETGRVIGNAAVGEVVTTPPYRERRAAASLAFARQRDPEEILTIVQEFLGSPHANTPAFVKLIAEHCAQLAEEAADSAEGQAIAEYIRKSFRTEGWSSATGDQEQ